MPPLDNPRHETFCQSYLNGRSAKASYIEAGYETVNPQPSASRLLRNVKVVARLSELTQERQTTFKLEIDDVIHFLSAIVSTDVNELMSLHRVACRHCHGCDHAYQWRTPREFEAAVARHECLSSQKKRGELPPDAKGGFGYSWKSDPDPDCPECDGYGEPLMWQADTRTLSPGADMLFAGVKQHAHGFHIKTYDKMRAVALLTRCLGMFDRPQQQPEDKLAALIREINERGSRAVLTATLKRAAPSE
ncbi:terminase small subunit [Loktanella sp. DJP18]|uniref:terminase small subunit n=1 Tax=Loktanella sp. DJP18 TaxID=3409788 RepID=UPI003BB57FBF